MCVLKRASNLKSNPRGFSLNSDCEKVIGETHGRVKMVLESLAVHFICQTMNQSRKIQDT